MTTTQWNAYLKSLRSNDFIKLSRMRFLQPDGTTAFALDNNPLNKKSGAFIESGSLNVNMQNGTRRTMSVTLANLDGEFDYNYNKVWFGTEIALDMGLVLPDGTEIYFPQGVFRINKPTETVQPDVRTAEFQMTDKWSSLDGMLNGVLETSYIVPQGANIFAPIAALLQTDRGDGIPLDSVQPVFTNYYNGKTQELADGTTANLTDAPYTLTIDGTDQTAADVILGLCSMLNAWVGYDASGRLRVDPSQDDILDTD